MTPGAVRGSRTARKEMVGRGDPHTDQFRSNQVHSANWPRAGECGGLMRVPIGFVLAVAMGLSLVVAAGGTIGYLSVVATESTGLLIADKGRLAAARTLRLVEGEMQRVKDQAELLAAAIEKHEDLAGTATGLADVHAMAEAFLNALPVSIAVVSRGPEDIGISQARTPITLPDVDASASADAAPGWGEPLRLTERGPFGLPFTQVMKGGYRVTLLMDLDRLSERLAEAVGANPDTAFLIDGDRTILAHSRPRDVPPGSPLGAAPVDEVMGMIAHPTPFRRLVPGLGDMIIERGDGPAYAIAWFPLGPEGRFLVGSYYRADQLGAPSDAVDEALIGSGALLVLVIGGAFLLGNRIGRPIRSLASVAKRMETLAVQDAPRLPRSSLREIDDANQAVNAAIGGLGAFSRYVPRELVLRLLKPDAIGALQSTTREVTVLFTDIAGYTAAAARMTAEETAAFLNHHFELLTACVDAEGGTVDKFIGDSLMAFWGAPEPRPDHAARAARACRAMAAAFAADTIMTATGARLRIGLHSGTVVVGNIGAISRTSYTVIGDAVNVAARLEQLGKTIDAEAPIIALTSAETDALLPADLRGTSIGHHLLRGRAAETEVMRLV